MNRKERRSAERQQRHQAAQTPDWIKAKLAARAAVMERISQQGISPQDLAREYDKGYKDGFMAAGVPITKGCYAAVCLAVHELFGFGKKRCVDVLRNIDERLIYMMDSQEYADKVLDEIGLEIRWADPMDRIAEKG